MLGYGAAGGTAAADPSRAESSSSSSTPLSPAMTQSLKAYLSLPLSQYSVLDPRWISNLPEDWEQQLQQQQEQEERIAEEEQLQEKQEAKEAQLAAASNHASAITANGDAAYISAPAGNGVSTDPNRSSLEDPTSSSSESASVTSSSGSSSSPGTDVLSIPPVDAAGMSTGVFLLKVPLQEIVGIDLKPQVVIQVHADTRNGKVGPERGSWDRSCCVM